MALTEPSDRSLRVGLLESLIHTWSWSAPGHTRGLGRRPADLTTPLNALATLKVLAVVGAGEALEATLLQLSSANCTYTYPGFTTKITKELVAGLLAPC